MQIPIHRKSKLKLVLKSCAICNEEFVGISSRKYCDLHLKNRIRVKKQPEEVTVKNQLIKHGHKEFKMHSCQCALEGCTNVFEVKLYPNQFVYPKYCEEHRSEYKRLYFKKFIHEYYNRSNQCQLSM